MRATWIYEDRHFQFFGVPCDSLSASWWRPSKVALDIWKCLEETTGGSLSWTTGFGEISPFASTSPSLSSTSKIINCHDLRWCPFIQRSSQLKQSPHKHRLYIAFVLGHLMGMVAIVGVDLMVTSKEVDKDLVGRWFTERDSESLASIILAKPITSYIE